MLFNYVYHLVLKILRLKNVSGQRTETLDEEREEA